MSNKQVQNTHTVEISETHEETTPSLKNAYVHEAKLSKRTKKHVLCFSIVTPRKTILATLIIGVMVAFIVSFGNSTPVDIPEIPVPENTEVTVFESKDPTHLQVKSAKNVIIGPAKPVFHAKLDSCDDLQLLNDFTQTIDILALSFSMEGINVSSEGFPQVTKIQFLGKVSEEWVQYLVEQSPNLESLLININGLCQGAQIANRKALKSPQQLEEVSHLTLQNSSECPIIGWIFKWNFSNLTTISLKNIKFSKPIFDDFYTFLNMNKNSIQKMEMENCKLCDECDISLYPKELEDKVFQKI